MTPLHGREGTINVPDTDSGAVDQTGFDIYQVLNTALDGQTWTINEVADNQQYAAFGGTVSSGAIGLYGWSASVTALFPKGGAQMGEGAGSLTYTAGYNNKVRAYTLNINWPFDDQAAGFGDSAKVALPGIPTWGGSVDMLIDDTTPIDIGSGRADAAGSTGAAATFRIADQTADATLAGNIIVTGVTPSVDITRLSTVSQTFIGNGNLAAAGTLPLLPTGNIGIPDEAEVVFGADANRDFTGRAFLSSLSITVAMGALTRVSATVQGTGALDPDS